MHTLHCVVMVDNNIDTYLIYTWLESRINQRIMNNKWEGYPPLLLLISYVLLLPHTCDCMS